MVKAVFILMTLLGALTCRAQQIKVMTFNLRFGELADMRQIANVIMREKPDLVALQEVDINTHREIAVKAGSANYIAQLSGYTKMHAVFGRTISYRGGEYGVAILSKYSFEQTDNDLYRHSGAEPRTALSVVVRVGDYDSLRFVCTHLDCSDNAVRLAQIRELCAKYKGSSMATIVAGDFNESEGESVDLFKTVFTQACSGSGATFPALSPERKIDYIGYYPQSGFKNVKCRNIDTSAISDHRMLVVKLKLK